MSLTQGKANKMHAMTYFDTKIYCKNVRKIHRSRGSSYEVIIQGHWVLDKLVTIL